MTFRNSPELSLNIYERPPQNPEWHQKQENIDLILNKIRQHNLLKRIHFSCNEQLQENDPLLLRSHRLNKKLEEFDNYHEEQLKTYRKILQTDKEHITNAISQRRRMGSFVKHVRSISTTVLKPLIQVNNIVNLQSNDKKLENQVIMRQQIKSIQENRKTIENCSKRLQQLFKEDFSNQGSRVQSHLEQRNKKKKNSIDFIRNLKFQSHEIINSKMHKLLYFFKMNTSTSITNKHQSFKRVKERLVCEAIEKVERWRQMFTEGLQIENGEIIKVTLNQAAELVGIPKKTLEDYTQLFKKVKLLTADIKQFSNEKMGFLRSYLRKNQNKLKKKLKDQRLKELEIQRKTLEMIKEQNYLQKQKLHDDTETTETYDAQLESSNQQLWDEQNYIDTEIQFQQEEDQDFQDYDSRQCYFNRISNFQQEEDIENYFQSIQ
ncbi:unnamed protein product [Paramecium sonneborni]|uniref:Uncharacterized protein n=1 Tax=Paramecium sonneborni TaxID=65129 RepID=A0A8S1KV22_9CILI|nr:unnamed protein product [Paramecium sonneborni]